MTDEQKALFVPGAVIEIEYKSDAPVWLIAKAADENPNPNGNWVRGVNPDTFIVDGYVASDNSKVQYTYEQLAAYWGDDFMNYTTAIANCSYVYCTLPSATAPSTTNALSPS